MPWIQEFVEGVEYEPECGHCGRGRRSRLSDHVKAVMEPNRARFWPDMLGCGSAPAYVVSMRFVDALRGDGMRVELGGRVEVVEPLRNRLSLADVPDYRWVDGERLQAAKLNFAASGYVGVRRCPRCGTIDFSVKKSEFGAPKVFVHDASSGLDLFTADASRMAFYCTERVLQCAKRHRLTNIAFRPVEEPSSTKPIKY